MVVSLLLLYLARTATSDDKIFDFNYDSISGTTWLNEGTASIGSVDLTGYTIAEKADSRGSFESVCFDSDSACLKVDYDISPSKHSSLTIELYSYQLSKANNYGWVVSQDNGGYDRSVLMHDTRYNTDANGGVAQGVGHSYTAHSPLAENEWNHIIAVWDGSAHTAGLYVNDDPVTETTESNGDGTSYFCFNLNPIHGGHQWNGCFAKVAIYDYALSESEIESLQSDFTGALEDTCFDVVCEDGFECDETDGTCARDCDIFDIDGFLQSCSADWATAQAALSTETAALTAADEALQAAINAEAATRVSDDEALQTAITDEASTRLSADDALQTAITEEASTRLSTDDALQVAIEAEALTRESDDGTLQGVIDAEASTRLSNDDTLQAAIDAEATTRLAADDALQLLIDGLQSDCDNINTRLESFKPLSKRDSAAFSVGVNGDSDAVDGVWQSYKDMFIVMLLVANIIVMFYIHCVSKWCNGRNKHKHQYRTVQYLESDVVDSEANLIK